MKKSIPDALLIAGSVLMSYGVWLAYEPGGFIVLGALALAAGVVLARAL
jgi:hypothetical protein